MLNRAQLAAHRVPSQAHLVTVILTQEPSHAVYIASRRTQQPTVTAEHVRIGQLAGCLEALHSGVTTILDHFHAANTPEMAEASLAATVQSGARVVWCPARQSPATQLLPSLAFAKEEETKAWQLAKLKEWGRDGGKLSPDGRVTLGLA